MGKTASAIRASIISQRDRANLRLGEKHYLIIAAEETLEAGFIEIIGPFGDIVVAADDGELKRSVGDVDDTREEAGAVVVDDRDDAIVAEEHVAGMPVGVNDLLGPVVDAERLHFFGGFAVGGEEEGEQLGDFAIFVGVRNIGGNGAQAGLDCGGRVIAAAGGLPFAFEFFKQLVIEGQDAAAVEGASRVCG